MVTYVHVYAVQVNPKALYSSICGTYRFSDSRYKWCRCNPPGSRGQNVVLHHRHSAPHVLLNAFQGLSFVERGPKETNRFPQGLSIPFLTSKALASLAGSYMEAAGGIFSPSGLFAELTVIFCNRLQHAKTTYKTNIFCCICPKYFLTFLCEGKVPAMSKPPCTLRPLPSSAAVEPRSAVMT